MTTRDEHLESQLNEMTAKGQILEALDAFYAEGCCFEEGDGSRVQVGTAH
jgi:hypothetical protein